MRYVRILLPALLVALIFTTLSSVAPRQGGVHAQTGTLTIPNPAPAASDLFGMSVAAVGAKMIVGAQADDPGGVTNAGSAYVFDGTTGALLLTIPNPDPDPFDSFGASVAGVGANILVGAPRDDPGGVSNAGSAYIRPEEVASICPLVFPPPSGCPFFGASIPNPAPAANDLFGASLAAIGTRTIVVGAPLDDPGAVANAGSAYLFDTVGGLILNIPNPEPGPDDLFGRSVAAAGANILVGAPRDDPGGVLDGGSAYLFSGSLPLGALLLSIPNPAPALGDGFGISVAGIGGNILVGAYLDDPGGVVDAGSAYLFESSSTTATPTPTPTSTFAGSFHDAKVSKLDSGGRDLALGGDGIKDRDVQVQCQNLSAHTDTIRCTLEIAGLPGQCWVEDRATGVEVLAPGGVLVNDLSSYLAGQTKKFVFKMRIICSPIPAPTSIAIAARADHDGDDGLGPDNDDSNPLNNTVARSHVLKR